MFQALRFLLPYQSNPFSFLSNPSVAHLKVGTFFKIPSKWSQICNSSNTGRPRAISNSPAEVCWSSKDWSVGAEWAGFRSHETTPTNKTDRRFWPIVDCKPAKKKQISVMLVKAKMIPRGSQEEHQNRMQCGILRMLCTPRFKTLAADLSRAMEG